MKRFLTVGCVAAILLITFGRVSTGDGGICYYDSYGSCNFGPGATSCPLGTTNSPKCILLNNVYHCSEDGMTAVDKEIDINYYGTVTPSTAGYYDYGTSTTETPCYVEYQCRCNSNAPCSQDQVGTDSTTSVFEELVDYETWGCGQNP